MDFGIDPSILKIICENGQMVENDCTIKNFLKLEQRFL